MNQVAELGAPNGGSPTDAAVISRILDGHPESFELLMRRHNRRVYRVVRAILRDEAEVEDAMQEAYLNAYAHLRDFSGQSQFATWLTRIAVHEAFGRLRRRRHHESLGHDDETEDPLMTAPQSSPEQNASDGELRDIIERAVDALPEAYRMVFMFRAVEGLSVAETAESLEIREETVKTRLHRARDLLRKDLVSRVGSTLPAVFDFHLSRCDRVVTRVLERIRPKG